MDDIRTGTTLAPLYWYIVRGWCLQFSISFSLLDDLCSLRAERLIMFSFFSSSIKECQFQNSQQRTLELRKRERERERETNRDALEAESGEQKKKMKTEDVEKELER